jgi:hypothetical protein
MADEDRKIFIDEDWKAQVQREREQARNTQEEQPKAEEESAAAPAAEGEQQQPGEEAATPFMNLVQTLATQALFALGVIAPQGAEEVPVHLGEAKLVIDMLADLREKTKGNLAAEEQQHLNEAVNELQRIYVARAQQAQQQSMKDAGVDLNNLKNPNNQNQ